MQERVEKNDVPRQAALQTCIRRTLFREGLRSFAIMASCHLIALVLTSLTLSEMAWLSILSTVVVVAIYILLGWSDGAARGEKAVAMNEMIASQRATYGREPDEKQIAAMYEPRRGIIIAAWILAFGAAVALILGVVFSLINTPTEAYRDAGAAVWFLSNLEVGARLVMVPFYGLFALAGTVATWTVPLCFLLYPAAQLLGYRSGPKQRGKVHKAIEDHAVRVRKRQQRERAAKKATAAKRPPKR